KSTTAVTVAVVPHPALRANSPLVQEIPPCQETVAVAALGSRRDTTVACPVAAGWNLKLLVAAVPSHKLPYGRAVVPASAAPAALGAIEPTVLRVAASPRTVGSI